MVPLRLSRQVLLQRSGLPVRYHRRAIADGMLLAILLRVAAMCFGAAALQRFGWLKVGGGEGSSGRGGSGSGCGSRSNPA